MFVTFTYFGIFAPPKKWLRSSVPRKQKSLISFFLEDPRKITEIENFLFFGTGYNDILGVA